MMTGTGYAARSSAGCGGTGGGRRSAASWVTAPRYGCSCQLPGGPRPKIRKRSMTEPGRLRVFLVDDHAMFRAGVRAELGVHVDVVGEASAVPEAIQKIGVLEPDVVLLDVHM